MGGGIISSKKKEKRRLIVQCPPICCAMNVKTPRHCAVARYMGLSGLSLQSEPGILPLHPALNVSMRAADRLPRGPRAGSDQPPGGGGWVGVGVVFAVVAVPVCAVAAVALLQTLRRR